MNRSLFLKSIADGLKPDYPSTTPEMVGECLDAYLDAKPIPHGIIGMFVKANLEEVPKSYLLKFKAP